MWGCSSARPQNLWSEFAHNWQEPWAIKVLIEKCWRSFQTTVNSLERSLHSRAKFTKKVFGLSSVNNQERSAFSLTILPAVLRACSQKTTIPVTSHIKPIRQGQADLPGRPGPQPYRRTVCALASQANTHSRVLFLGYYLGCLSLFKKKKRARRFSPLKWRGHVFELL